VTRTAPRFRLDRNAIQWSRVVGSAWWLLPLLLAAAFYFWTASSGGNGVPLRGEKTDYYNLLTDGFRGGHLYLPVKPAPELLALPDPYDPVANAPYRLHDASLYKGRYYLYFGPVPVLLAFLPWSLLPLRGDLPGNLAAALFGLLGLTFNLLFLRFAIRRWLPETPTWMAATGAVGLTMANIVPFALRRPAFYEQAITAGYFLTSAAAWLLLSGLFGERRSLRRIGLASLCLGLAVGCRPNLGLLSAALVVVAIVLWREGLPRRRLLAVVFGPIALCAVALMAYNVARFGSPTEFGQAYQLAGADVRLKDAYSLAYLTPGLFYYLLAPARHDINFPFFHILPPPSYPGTLPVGYDGVEPTGGVLTNVPITLLALVALAVPWHRRIGLPRELGRFLAVGVALMLVLVVFVSILFWGTTERYEVDFAWMLALTGVLVWLALANTLRSAPGARRTVQVAGVALIGWSAAFSIATSLTGYYDSLKSTSPATYRQLADLASPLQTAASSLAGKPLMLEVNNATVEGRGPGERYLSSVTFSKPGSLPGPAEVVLVSPSSRTVTLLGGYAETIPGTRLRVSGGAGPPQLVTATGGALQIRMRFKRGLNTLRFTPQAPRGSALGDFRVVDLRIR
jgi:hypothetical protein